MTTDRQSLNQPGRRRRLTAASAVALLAGALAALAPAQAANESYGVFCANNKIEVDSRSEEQMRSQRGACQFGRFPSRSDAENFARRNFGGVGGACRCR